MQRSQSISKGCILQRNLSLDILKVMLAVLVVGIHTAFLSDVSQVANHLTANGLFRIAVPIFFIINGFFFFVALESKPINWFKHILLLYLFWMLFYSYFWLRPNELGVYQLSTLLETIIVGYHHLWYLPGMLGAGAMLYLLRGLSTSSLLTISILLFSVGLAVQYLGNFEAFDSDHINSVLNVTWVYRNFLFFAFPFFTIGYLLKRTGWYKNIRKEYLLLTVCVGVLLISVESYFNFVLLNEYQDIDLFLSLLIICPAVFLIFLTSNIPWDNKSIALLSTAIYFIHPFFVALYIKFTSLENGAMLVLVLASSLIASWFMIKINSKFKIML